MMLYGFKPRKVLTRILFLLALHMLSEFCSAQCNRIGDQEGGLKLLMGLEI